MGLFIAYYGSQRSGDALHSPKELPSWSRLGARFFRNGPHCGPVGPRELISWPITMSSKKAEMQQDVLYWYQAHGRRFASEYLGKIYLAWDGITKGRTDGALIRITASRTSGSSQSLPAMVAFAKDLSPNSAAVFAKVSSNRRKPKLRGKTAMLKGSQSKIFLATVMALAFALPAWSQSSAPGDDKKPQTTSTAPADPAKPSVKPKGSDDPALAGYTIGEQDVLDIDVWQEKELSGPAVVRPDGKITMPLVGEIYVVGMTPVQLQGELTKRLEPFVTVPQVSVSVHEINSRKVYVMGQVAHEGVFRINSTTTVSQILVQAGGLREYAKKSKIYVLRNINGKQVRLPFNYNSFIKGQKNGQDFVLKPGDTVVVP